MDKITLSRSEYRDKVYACWLGKSIGGTLGTPHECTKFVNDLTFYDPVPTEPLPNDDLDLQLIWLKMLEDRGTSVSVADFADYWMKHGSAYPWNEYGFCTRNLSRGLRPPVSGWFENYYVDEMGSPIRSEIWACIAPADPQRAASLAWMDSAMDHAGGEGMWGEMFWAAVESAAFVVQDPLSLIRIGLAMIPPSCNIARVIREAIWCHQNGIRWPEARDRIVAIYGNPQPCNAIQNHGFTVVGWLYGKDFGDKLCRAVNCGYDTDCTGATLGAVLGIIGGTAGVPEEWVKPVGLGIVLHKFTRDLDAPKDVEELTERTITIAEEFARVESARVAFGEATVCPPDPESLLAISDDAETARSQDIRAATAVDGSAQITLHYGGEPVLMPGVARRMSVSCRKAGAPVTGFALKARVPEGWGAAGDADGLWVTAPEFAGIASLGVQVTGPGISASADFAILSPSEARGFPSGTNIEYCDACHGRKGSCVCP